MKKVLCFGELLLRFSPTLNGAWLHESAMPVFMGGAELNAATALARWDVPVAYCTALPNHSLSADLVQAVTSRGIDTSAFIFSGNRIGTYYLPQGTDLKHAGVIYDRAYSSFWELRPGVINWDEILNDISWFHFSAISPALNEHAGAVCLEAVKAASARGITVSVDLNYRAKLWQWGKDPSHVLPQLAAYCNVIMGNLWAEEKMLGIPLPVAVPDTKESLLDLSLQVSALITKQFPRCRQVANTFRFDEGEGVRYYASLYAGEQLYVSSEYNTPAIVDKVGSGDTFMAGLIYGNVHGLSPQQTIDFATAAAFNKLFIKGDSTTSGVEDIQKQIIPNG